MKIAQKLLFVLLIISINISYSDSSLYLAPPGMSLDGSTAYVKKTITLNNYRKLIYRKDNKNINFSPFFNYKGLIEDNKIVVKGKKILVLGSGPGAICFRLILDGATEVLGIEIDENSVLFAEYFTPYIYNSILKDNLLKDFPEIGSYIAGQGTLGDIVESITNKRLVKRDIPNLRFITGDASENLIDGHDVFDIVLIPFLLGNEHGINDYEGIQNVLKNTLRLLKEKGILVIAPRFSKKIIADIASGRRSNPFLSIENIYGFGYLAIIVEHLFEKSIEGKRLRSTDHRNVFIVINDKKQKLPSQKASDNLSESK